MSVRIDLSIGATALIANYNGLEEAPHIRDAIGEIAMDGELGRLL